MKVFSANGEEIGTLDFPPGDHDVHFQTPQLLVQKLGMHELVFKVRQEGDRFVTDQPDEVRAYIELNNKIRAHWYGYGKGNGPVR